MADTGVKGALARKLGPAPVWAWLVAAVVGYYLYSRYKSGQASGNTSAVSAPSSLGTGTTSSGLGTASAPASGQGSAADNLNPALLDALTNQSNSLVGVNSNLVTGLLGAQNAVYGLGSTALAQSGAAEQAILAGYQGNGTTYGPITPAAVYSPAGGSTTTSAQPVVQVPGGFGTSYSPSTGVTTTSSGAQVKSTSYGGLSGPSIFAFK